MLAYSAVMTSRVNRLKLGAVLLTAVLVVSACGRDSNNGGGEGESTTTTAAKSAAKGDFGDLTALCGPGDAKGATARGVTDTTIKVSTMADPTNTIQPGLGQEFFEVADAFVKWCNDAGGILGRKIELTKRDAKLFDVAARTIDACQTDFMLVGNGNPLDAAGVKPRLDCKLGMIPGYQVSPAAINASLQVLPTQNPVNEQPIGPFKALQAKYPDAVQAIGLVGSNLPDLVPSYTNRKTAYEQSGFKVVDFQLPPPQVDNWRPYVESAKAKGVKLLTGLAQDVTPYFRSANDAGFAPQVMVLGTEQYNDKLIQAAKQATLPPTWLAMSHWPAEMADQRPAVKQMIEIIKDAVPDAKLADFHFLGINAWLLWAQSVKECGSNVTVDCVLQKAAAHDDWTAGGLWSAHSTDPTVQHTNNCFLLMKVSADGFEYDKTLTKPNRDVFNCAPGNIAKVS